VRPPPSKQPRCAFLEGFSLHANTHLHANDRQGLERLCRYGARGALAVKGAAGVRAILEHLGLPTKSASLAPARAPPQAAWC
jgi:hypothetical protein